MKKTIKQTLTVLSYTFFILVLMSCGDEASSPPAEETITQTIVSGEYKLELSYPGGLFDFGSSVDLSLSIEYPEDDNYILLPPEIKSSDRYSNTLITSVNEGSPILSGSGSAVSIITFTIEAWLPGELVFPPLSVRFEQELSTDEIIMNFVSAFSPDGERELAPLYLPALDSGVSPSPALIILAIVTVLIIVFGAFYIIRRRKKKEGVSTPVKSRAELIEEFRIKFIEVEGSIDLRDAFYNLLKIEDFELDEQQRQLIDEARFSKSGVDYQSGLKILNKIYDRLNDEL